MQSDMHYYGTYAMARAAGLRAEISRDIATASQFIDDNTNENGISFRDGARVDIQETSHGYKTVVFERALDNPDKVARQQRRIWVPFHFLPGNEGDSYTERLVCRKDSEIAHEVIDHHLSLANSPFAVELMGVTAHVYADTFSHYGFSGVSSRRNKVDCGSFEFHNLDLKIKDYMTDRAHHFFKKYGEYGGLIPNIKSWIAEDLSGALGHGAVATYPDLPYLQWSFRYEEPEREEDRDNQKNYTLACKALYGIFKRFGEVRPEFSDGGGSEFADIEDKIKAILSVQEERQGRSNAWKAAAQRGDLFAAPETITEYDANIWKGDLRNLHDSVDSKAALEKPIFRFYQAAAIHRNYVLRELMPDHGLIID